MRSSFYIFEFLEIIPPFPGRGIISTPVTPCLGPRYRTSRENAILVTTDKPFLPFTPPPFLRLETAIDWAATANPSAIRSIWPFALDGWKEFYRPIPKSWRRDSISNPLPSTQFFLPGRYTIHLAWKYAPFEIRNENFSISCMFVTKMLEGIRWERPFGITSSEE